MDGTWETCPSGGHTEDTGGSLPRPGIQKGFPEWALPPAEREGCSAEQRWRGRGRGPGGMWGGWGVRICSFQGLGTSANLFVTMDQARLLS